MITLTAVLKSLARKVAALEKTRCVLLTAVPKTAPLSQTRDGPRTNLSNIVSLNKNGCMIDLTAVLKTPVLKVAALEKN